MGRTLMSPWQSALSRRALGLALLTLATVAPAMAGVCSLDDRPGATLLLPYFEVDLDHADGRTTLFSVSNASATAVLTNVVVWTDLGVPTLTFPLYLTGYDVQTFNLRDLFGGSVAKTASAAQDPLDVISPKGSKSQDLAFASCAGFLPPADLPAAVLNHLRAAHTGQSSPVWGACGGQNRGDHVARGYVTVDTVSRCATLTPAEPGYFGPGGMATSQNVLWGDFFYVDPARVYADGENLIRLKADPAAFAGQRTFYGRYVNGSGADGRQPLPPDWAARFLSSGAFTEGTDLIVWRDSGQVTKPFPCGLRPSWYPLLLSTYLAFDEEENPFLPPTFPISAQPPLPAPSQLPAEANRLQVGTEPLPVPFDFGWIYLHLGHFQSGSAFDPSQGWVGVAMKAGGRFSVGFGATPLSNGCQPNGPQPFN
ncbi:MAG TPA: hypothetical protein VIA62_26065 [Thermoanaerobaculia bacterium]|jgi:hypothetical protein|nr:hypothetical protein [Thermoanaerobaculia bacterium]